jgi:hypothetical protein
LRRREECLNEHVFVSLDDARSKIEKWRIQYNRKQLHSSVGNLTPEEFAAQAADPGSWALAHTARPVQELLAAAVPSATASDSKIQQFSGHPQGALRVVRKTAI